MKTIKEIFMRTSKSILLLTSLAILSFTLISCASETVVKEVEVIKEVPGETVTVIEEVEVIKEVPGETITVVKEVPGETVTKIKLKQEVITVAPTPIPGGGIAISVDMSDFVFSSNEPNPVYGGTVRMTFGVSVKHTDHHQMPVAQGAGPHNFTVMYNGLIRKNPNDGMQYIMPDLAS